MFLTIGAQIAEAVLAHKPKLEKSAVRERVVELLELVGIDRAQERMALYPHNFSGGMRQRVVLAIALAGIRTFYLPTSRRPRWM